MNTTGLKGITAIYIRRSVSDKEKGNNSLSIPAQRDECIRFVGDCDYRIYCDYGKSAKDIDHRPAFQQMMQDARDGLISRIVVKKYDRFSRNMREYLNVSNELDGYGVSVYSLSEPFNTSTKEGRMMRNNLLNFAEFERETIAARVADAYQTKARETGFYQGGKVQFGYIPERREVNGKMGSVLVPSENAEAVRIAFEIYQQYGKSLADIINYYVENNVNATRPTKRTKSGLSNMDRSHLSRILQNPLYVRADKEVYAYFAAKGYDILDDITAYDGVHGVFMHKSNDGTYVKVGYHEGLVDANTWLNVQDKKSHNQRIPNNGTAMNSWLVGLAKCAHCGHGLQLIYSENRTKTRRWRYFSDFGAYTRDGCIKKRLAARPDEVEETVFQAMKERIEQLVIAKREAELPDRETESMRAEIIRIDDEIRKLMEKLADADSVLFDYIQSRISTLHTQKSDIERRMQTMKRKRQAIDTEPLTEPMSRWDSLTVQEKHAVAVSMIDAVYVSDESGINVKFCI